MKAFILVGGLATRLGDLAKQTPKAMQDINGKPFLQYQIEYLRDNGVKEIVLLVGHLSDVIKNYFGNGDKFGVKINYSYEDVPLGTGGAVKNAERFVDGTFMVLNGDTYFEFDYEKLLNLHKQTNAKATLVLNKVPNAGDYGNVVLSEKRIIKFEEKSNKGDGLINCGVYMFEPEVLNLVPNAKKVSIETEVFLKLVERKQMFGLELDNYFVDIGVPKRLEDFRQKMR